MSSDQPCSARSRQCAGRGDRYWSHHGLRLSDHTSARDRPISRSSRSDIRASSARSRTLWRHKPTLDRHLTIADVMENARDRWSWQAIGFLQPARVLLVGDGSDFAAWNHRNCVRALSQIIRTTSPAGSARASIADCPAQACMQSTFPALTAASRMAWVRPRCTG